MVELFTMLGKLVVVVTVGCMFVSAIIMTSQNGYRTYQAWKETRE